MNPEDAEGAAAGRVERHTRPRAQEAIDRGARRRVRAFARDADGRDRRIARLGREWDVERTLETNASTLALGGAVLGTTVSRKWFALSAGVLAFLIQHALSGWCPPLPLLRRLGVRTRTEIDRERQALKALRGDYARAAEPEAVVRAVADSEPRAAGVREPDRVRRSTAGGAQERVDATLLRCVRLYAGQPPEILAERIGELQREWSVERHLQLNVAAFGLVTAGLAAGHDRRWGFATCAGLACFLLHALKGFDAPLGMLRRKGVRTRAEINREIFALKVLRGDFAALQRGPGPGSADAAFRAARV